MNRGKRLDIQALRAIAVLSVVIYHFWPDRLTGGFMGVDIFFVISGYLMTVTLMRDAEPVIKAKHKIKATRDYLANFYARRIKRLVPAAAVTLLSVLGLVYATGNLSLIQQTATQVSSSALFFQNWQLANDSVDYLANTDPTAVQHFWSLSLEEQFYLVWPIALVVILLVSANLVLSYKKRLTISSAIIPITLLTAGFFAYGFHLTQTEPALAYFVTPARIWELLLGGIIAFLPILKNYDLRLMLPWIGTVMIGYAIYSWGGDGFPGWHALVPTIGTALIIYAGGLANESKWSFENLLRFRPIQRIGDLSYSLYLWHWPLIILLPAIFAVDLKTHPQALLIKLGILALALIVAGLSYRFIEQKTQHIKLKKRYIYIAFIVITGFVAGLAYFTSNNVEAKVKDAVTELRSSVIDDANKCLGAKSIINKCEDSLGYINGAYSQIASNDKYDTVLNSGNICSSYDARKHTEKITDYCEVGDLEAKREITVWGDSHAQHWINPMDEIGRRNHIKVNIIGTSYCFGSKKYQANCGERFDGIKNSGVLDRSSAIIISMLYTAQPVNQDNGTVDAIATLHSISSNKNVFILEDVPFAGKQGGPNCNALKLSCMNSVEIAVGPIAQTSVDLVSTELMTSDRIIPTRDMFCDMTSCYSNIGGIQVYRDRNKVGSSNILTNSHMTASFAYSTWPILEQKLLDKGIIK